ncbi:hypothetical protein KDAU_65480 [Dictyobacter aurantiacus]|uniref:GFO/IDH/MocA-like oxidoreductase domain-containing protein n=2 Tax=Dictyobacter aurantiacus TaxID=1936993 RepID=A0A401ZQS8_9CHLR|nr:hypothetical protein KDAU_65480 [Dictyobacter aurantiacus]
MDAGSYPINLVRFLSGEEPEVVQATATLASQGVDRRMDADLRFPSGLTGHIRASLFSSDLLRISARITGDQGHMSVFNYVSPQAYHRLTVKTTSTHRTEHMAGDASYTYQLRAFARAINEGTPVLTNANDAIANMRVIDSVYRKAGLQPRMAAEDSPQSTPTAT